MNPRRYLIAAATLALSALTPLAQADPTVLPDKPEAVVDLATRDGVALVKGQWKYSDVTVVETTFAASDADGQPGTHPVRAYDYTPKAGGPNFDDSDWETIDPTTLDRRRTHGRVAFNWYRINLTVPERIGSFDPTGSTAVFETSVDDYAEIWVNGELPRVAGQMGGSVVAGWNAANRVVIGRGVKPGDKIQLAIFGINGPISASPTNYIYLHYAKLEFHKGSSGPIAVVPQEVNIEVVRSDPAIDEIVPRNPKLFKLADGFKFTEGPIWVRDDQGGHLLFSDPNSNIIYKYTAEGELWVFRTPSGYSGADIAEYGQPGSNGLTLDRQGRLTINEHGNHRVTRLEPDGRVTVLAERYQGKRLNSPKESLNKSCC